MTGHEFLKNNSTFEDGKIQGREDLGTNTDTLVVFVDSEGCEDIHQPVVPTNTEGCEDTLQFLVFKVLILNLRY